MFILRSFTNKNLNSSVAHLLVSQNNTGILIDVCGLDNSIINFLEKRHIKLTTIILTSGHINHGLGIDKIIQKYPEVNLIASPSEYNRLLDSKLNTSFFDGRPWTLDIEIKNKMFINQNFSLNINDLDFEFISFEINGENRVLIHLKNQDTLFVGDLILFENANFILFGEIREKQISEEAIRYINQNYGPEINIACGHFENTFRLDEVTVSGKTFREIIS